QQGERPLAAPLRARDPPRRGEGGGDARPPVRLAGRPDRGRRERPRSGGRGRSEHRGCDSGLVLAPEPTSAGRETAEPRGQLSLEADAARGEWSAGRAGPRY